MPMFLYILTTLLVTTRVESILARHNGFRHEAVDASRKRYDKRINPLILNTTGTEQCPATPTKSIYSIVFPSPDASPIEITTQSQVITSFFPEMTWCVAAPVALIPISGPPYLNQSTEYQTTAAGNGSCETIYVPTETTVCATTLTGIASKITVSECDQEITFSSEFGFTLQTPTPATTNFSVITPAPTVKRMRTYWLAHWQSLTAGGTPSDVDIKICTIEDDKDLECLRYQEVWEVVVVTHTSTTTRDYQLTTTVTGPGTLLIETMEVHIMDTIETVDLSTKLALETEVETESTSRGKKLVTRSETDTEAPTSTVYVTKHLNYKSSRIAPTTRIRVTSIAFQSVGTITRTQARPRPTLLEFPNF